MSFESLLIDTCTVKRFSEAGEDDYGQPTGAWNDHLTDEPCRLGASSGREVKFGAEVVIADYRLFIGDVDITEQDRVVVDGITYEVLLVLSRKDGIGDHHKECFMRLVR